MIKNFILAIWTVVAVVVFGVILPPLLFDEGFIVYQIIISTLLMTLSAAIIYIKYMDLYQIKDQISSSLDDHITELKENLEYQERLNAILYDVTMKMSDAGTDKNAVLDFILAKAMEAVPDSDFGSVLIVNEQGLFTFAACNGYDLQRLRTMRFKKEETFLWLATGGKNTSPVIIRDIVEFNRDHLSPETYKQHLEVVKVQVRSVLSAPIFIDNQLFGILNIDSLKENAFHEKDLTLARFLGTHIAFILKNNQLLEKAYYLSMFDKLTNIFNRTYFEDVFYEFQEKAFSQNKKFTLVIMDLNYLKKINDTYGHILGDSALKTFAEGVKKHLYASDIFARYGGDEFIALIDNVSMEQTQHKFEQIVSYFENVNLEYNGTLIPIQFSYGISEAPGESMILDILVKIADERMYSHKNYLKQKNQENPRFSAIR